MSDDPEEETSPPPRGASVIAWGLVLFGVCRVLDILLEAQATASATGQAVLVEWASSRLGILWTDGTTPVTLPRIARRIGTGIAVGLGAAFIVSFGLLFTHAAVIMTNAENATIAVLAIGLVTAGLHAWRDELLLHGVVLRALGAFGPDDAPSRADVAFRVIACGATSAGAALGRSDATAASVALAFSFGVLAGVLWVRDRGAWMPWATNTLFQFAFGTLLVSGMGHSRIAGNPAILGDRGLFDAPAAAVALALTAMAALGLLLRRMSPSVRRVG